MRRSMTLAAPVLLSLAVVHCGAPGPALAPLGPAASALMVPFEQTAPLFGDNGVLALAPADITEDPNSMGATCEDITARFHRYQEGLIDTKEWRSLMKNDAWQKLAEPIARANAAGCKPQGAFAQDDCGPLTQEIRTQFDTVAKSNEWAVVRNMRELMQVRLSYKAALDKQCELDIAPKLD